MPAASSPRSSSRPAGPDERLAGEVLLVAGLLADQHHPRALEPLTEDGLGGPAPEVAAAAAGGGLAQRLERAALGQERRGVVRFWGGSDPREGSVLRHGRPAARRRRPLDAVPRLLRAARLDQGQGRSPSQRAARHRQPDPARARAARAARGGALLRPRRRRLPRRAVRRLPRRAARRCPTRWRRSSPTRAPSSRPSAGSWPTTTRSRPTTCSARTPAARRTPAAGRL